MNYNEILKECEQMQAELECLIPTDGNSAVEFATKMAVYMARSGQLLADAKKMARAKRTSEIGETIVKIAKENFLSAKAQNALVDSIASEELHLVDWVEQINKACKYDIELCRSIISKEKEELRIAKMGY